MKYIVIKNWESFQHYKKRNPPWIKCYKSLLAKPEYYRLQDASKLLLHQLWLVSAARNNLIDFDIAWLRSVLKFKSKLTDKSFAGMIQNLIDNDFIEIKPGGFDSTLLADCKQVATPETETETDSRAPYIPHGGGDDFSQFNSFAEAGVFPENQPLAPSVSGQEFATPYDEDFAQLREYWCGAAKITPAQLNGRALGHIENYLKTKGLAWCMEAIDHETSPYIGKRFNDYENWQNEQRKRKKA